MTGQSSEPRPQTAYASLRAASDASAAAPAPAGASASTAPKPDLNYWRQEADKLDVLLQTLWAGFLEADANGLPTALADYVSAYTGAMRLKLTLMGYSAVPNRAFKAASAVNGKGRVP